MDKTDDPKRKPGRPKAKETIPICVRIPAELHPIYLKRGGAKWLRDLMVTFLVRK